MNDVEEMPHLLLSSTPHHARSVFLRHDLRQRADYFANPSMPLWASHPRIFLDVVNESEAMCPYCGMRYRIRRRGHVAGGNFDTRNLHQDRHQPYAARPAIDPQTPDRLIHSRESPEVAVDALGNTTLERITRWLRRR